MGEWGSDKLTPELKRAYLFQEHLAYLDTKRTEAYMNNNIKDWIKVCDRIFINISFILNDSDVKLFDEKIKLIKLKILSNDNSLIDDVRSFEILLAKKQHEKCLLYPKVVESIDVRLRRANKDFERKNTTEEIFEDD